MTIKKWHSLAFYIFRTMIMIGKEDYVKMMMLVYSQFIKVQDCLHKNIHCLQEIHKNLYGGFIQCGQALLGTRKVKIDPTKGSWIEHKNLAIKIYYVAQCIRMETFMKKVGKYIIKSRVQSGESLSDMIWKLQGALRDFITQLESAFYIKTWIVTIFMKYCSAWIISKD